MIKIWDHEAWEDYVYWQTQDKKTWKKINSLIKDIVLFSKLHDACQCVSE